MLATQTPLPTRRLDLVIRPYGDTGRYVVKDPRSGAFYQLGEQEHFLLTQLDGQKNACDACATFADRFEEALSEAELDAFLKMAEAQGLLESPERLKDGSAGNKETQTTTPRSALPAPR